MTQEIVLRAGEDKDVKFITNSWLLSYRNAPFVRDVPNKPYYYYQHKLLEQLIPRSVVRVACNYEDSDQILGWICAEPLDALVVHFCYVKKPFREFGIAKRLLLTLKEDYGVDVVMYTHKTPMCIHRRDPQTGDRLPGFADKIRENNIIYNPFLAFRTLPDEWEERR